MFLLLCVSSHVYSLQSVNQSTNQSIVAFFDLLMWQAREVSDDNWGQTLTPSDINGQINFLDVPFKSHPGFRVGLGYDNKDNPFDIQLYYTGYKTRGINRADVNSGEIHSAFSGNFYANNLAGDGISGPYYHHAGINWDILYNTVDLEVGRKAKIGQVLDLHPFIGLKGGSINQTLHTYWQDPFKPTTLSSPTPVPITTFSSATETLKNNFWGIGPSMGLGSTWHLYMTPERSFNLVGNISGAILWGHWKFSDVYRNNTPLSISIMNEPATSAAPMAKGYLGLEWTNQFNHANVSVRLGYEEQIWFNQIQYYIFEMGRANDSLALYGGVLDFSIHF